MRVPSFLLLCLLGVAGYADADQATPTLPEKAHVQAFLGLVDVHKTNRSTQFGAEYRSAQRWTYLDLRPFGGLMRTRKQSHLAYAGIARESKFSTAETGFFLAIDLAIGFYRHGGRSDVDLGFPVQLRTGASLRYRFQDGTRLGLAFHHMSNASMSRTNPGTETISLTYALPLP